MPITQAVAALDAKAMQCAALIGSAHRIGPSGAVLFTPLESQQITVAGFLNLFVAWEEFLESAFVHFMTGAPTLSGLQPVRYASPPSADAALGMLIGAGHHFNFASHDHVRKMARLYFKNGYPFEPHLSAVATDLADLRTMRNASAHISTTTQKALQALAQRIFGVPRQNIALYAMLIATDPRSTTNNTVFSEASDKLLTTAHLIAQG